MEPMQIVLILLAAAGVWAVVELALTLRHTRGVVDSLDKTMEQLNNTIEEARPMVAKLDGVVDELQPAVAQIEPLLKQANNAVEALSADLIEVNGVLRDVSAVSGVASSASNAVSAIADAASDRVQKFLGKARNSQDAATEHVLTEQASEGLEPKVKPEASTEHSHARQYFTYDEESAHE